MVPSPETAYQTVENADGGLARGLFVIGRDLNRFSVISDYVGGNVEQFPANRVVPDTKHMALSHWIRSTHSLDLALRLSINQLFDKSINHICQQYFDRFGATPSCNQTGEKQTILQYLSSSHLEILGQSIDYVRCINVEPICYVVGSIPLISLAIAFWTMLNIRDLSIVNYLASQAA